MYLNRRKFGKYPLGDPPVPGYFFLSRAHKEGLSHIYDLEFLICYAKKDIDIIEGIR